MDIRRDITHLVQSKIKEDFETVNSEKYTGFLKKDIHILNNDAYLDTILNDELMMSSPELYERGYKIFDLHVKPLSVGENQKIPPERFTNSINLFTTYQNMEIGKNIFPEPVGLIYRGGIQDLFLNPEGYFITKYVKGENLLDRLRKLEINTSEDTKKEREKTVGFLRNCFYNLRYINDQKLYLLDIAPRDIIICDNYHPVFADTEHIGFIGSKYQPPYFLKKQISNIKKEFKNFLKPKEIKIILKCLEED